MAGADVPDARAELARLAGLLDRDPDHGLAVILDLLAGEPRVKPSRGLLVDPGDTARRQWMRRVAAGAAVLGSPVLARVYEEVHDELADCAQLAAEVLTLASPHPDLSPQRRAALLALGR